VSNDNQQPTVAELQRANADLRDSLQRCEALVADCREKLRVKGERPVGNYRRSAVS
jgi:hypothetical protein